MEKEQKERFLGYLLMGVFFVLMAVAAVAFSREDFFLYDVYWEIYRQEHLL